MYFWGVGGKFTPTRPRQGLTRKINGSQPQKLYWFQPFFRSFLKRLEEAILGEK